MGKVVISVKNVSKWYDKMQVLRNVNLEVHQGEVVVICGPSGSGKSTLIRTINALESIQEGEIIVDGVKVDKKADLPSLRSKIGMVFQHFGLFPHMTILKNLILPQVMVRKISKQQAIKKAEEMLDRLKLIEHAHKYPSSLSGGQKQRVAIIRALCMDPIAILFDEPTSALDPEMVHEVLAIIQELATERHMTMCIVTHEMGFARKVANRIVFIEKGEILFDGPKDRFFEHCPSTRIGAFLQNH